MGRVPYRVEISAQAWGQIGTVPAGVFRQISDHLTALSERLTRGEAPEGSNGTLLAWPVSGFVAVYVLDSVAHTVTLLEVAKRLA
jgi:hypothetical protein